MLAQQHSLAFLAKMTENKSLEQLRDLLRPSTEAFKSPLKGHKSSDVLINQRRQHANISAEQLPLSQAAEIYQHNIENLCGEIRVPLGLAGPISVRGLHANGNYFLPLATTEAALIASYHRGSKLINAAGGCTTLLLNEGVCRAPGFAFANLSQVGEFLLWLTHQQSFFAELVSQSSNYCRLQNCHYTVEGNHVYCLFEYTTGDAAGQNMVTIASQRIFDYIVQTSPVPIRHAFVEANLSGDKKASHQSFMAVRGKKVTSEVFIEEALLLKNLHTSSEMMEQYWRMSAMGGVLSGTIGVQGHYANGLAALFLATGQDVACVSEASIGVTRFEAIDTPERQGLYACVTLPNLIVGTKGGGTQLPDQSAALQLMNLPNDNSARALAEICAALCLAGELSIIGALCANHFSRAHQTLARGKTEKE